MGYDITGSPRGAAIDIVIDTTTLPPVAFAHGMSPAEWERAVLACGRAELFMGLTLISDFLQYIVARVFSLSAASIQKHLAPGREPPRHAPRRFGDLFGVTGEANTQMAFAARTEGASGRGANTGFVDEF